MNFEGLPQKIRGTFRTSLILLKIYGNSIFFRRIPGTSPQNPASGCFDWKSGLSKKITKSIRPHFTIAKTTKALRTATGQLRNARLRLFAGATRYNSSSNNGMCPGILTASLICAKVISRFQLFSSTSNATLKCKLSRGLFFLVVASPGNNFGLILQQSFT